MEASDCECLTYPWSDYFFKDIEGRSCPRQCNVCSMRYMCCSKDPFFSKNAFLLVKTRFAEYLYAN